VFFVPRRFVRVLLSIVAATKTRRANDKLFCLCIISLLVLNSSNDLIACVNHRDNLPGVIQDFIFLFLLASQNKKVGDRASHLQ
jgi:hypothetical protein